MNTILQTLSQVFHLLLPSERRRLYRILLAMLGMALIDVIGIASIMPFIAIVIDPAAIQHHKTIAFIYRLGHFHSQNIFLVSLGCMVFILLLLSNTIALISTWVVSNFTHYCEHSLSSRLLQTYLQKKYIFFLNNNSTDLSKNILTEVNGVVFGVIIPAMRLIAKSLITLLILLLIILIDPVLALSLVCLIGGAYALIYGFVKYQLARLGMLDFSATTLRHKICAEAMQGVKDYKLRGTEPNIINRYSEITQKIAKTRALADAIIHLPYFALEALAFSAILLIIVYLLLTHHRITDTIPLLGIYVFACYRFLPALQQIFLSIASIRMRSEAVNNLVNELKHYRDFSPRDGEKKMALQHELVLRNVSFNYPDSTKPTIQQISINVPANKTIGLIGNSGAGKTTTADLILGLLIPSQGEITIDGIPLTEKNITEWQNNIGYVAQNFYLLDDTIAANIALGLQGAEINMQKVISAAKLANIHHYIMQELRDQYATIIGERGIRLSGGQRQRIAIARALYHNPDVLILDEATSALDNETENVILEAIQQLLHQKTIILIAHRLTTIKVCEEVFLFNNGRVVDRGSYEYLSLHSEYFRKFAALNNPLTSHTDITID